MAFLLHDPTPVITAQSVGQSQSWVGAGSASASGPLLVLVQRKHQSSATQPAAARVWALHLPPPVLGTEESSGSPHWLPIRVTWPTQRLRFKLPQEWPGHWFPKLSKAGNQVQSEWDTWPAWARVWLPVLIPSLRTAGAALKIETSWVNSEASQLLHTELDVRDRGLITLNCFQPRPPSFSHI